MSGKVSMVITCYNKQNYIGEMLESVIAQKYDNIEVIIVNDGSTDNSLAIVNQFMPQLKQRGYDIILINQDNQGRSAALKNGLNQISGDYICMPDGDDLLLPEYVSAPVQYLQTHSDIDWVACDFTDIPYDIFGNPYLRSGQNSFVNEMNSEKLVDAWLLWRIATVCSIVVIKADYFKRCSIATNIFVDKNYNQECQVLFPLFLNGGKCHYLNQPIYIYRRYGVVDSVINKSASSKELMLEYNELLFEVVSKVLKKHSAFDENRERCLRVLMINRLFVRSTFFDEEGLVDKLLDIVTLNITRSMAVQAGFCVLYYFVSNQLLQLPLPREIEINPNKRIIAYGAFGKAAKQIRRGLHNADICPSVYWDITAKEKDEILSVPVMEPEFSNIRDDDVILMLLKSANISKEVTDSIRSINNECQIVYYFDVLDYLVNYYFAQE